MTMLPFGDAAPVSRRAIAYIIDAAIGFGISFIIPMAVMIAVVTGGGDLFGIILIIGPLSSLLGLAWFIVYTVMQAGQGSIGMRTQGIRLVNEADGSALGFGRSLLRNVIWGLAAMIVVGYFTVLFDGSGRFQGWHDRVAGALMLDQRAFGHDPAVQPAASAQPPLVPDHGSALPTAMPGFAAPAQQTSMPGFAQGPGAFAPPQPGAAAQPDAGPQVPVGPPDPAAAQQPAQSTHAEQQFAAPQPAADEEFAEHTVLSPRINRDLPDDPLISFVPGVTQEPPRRAVEPVQPEYVQPEYVQPEPVQSEYVQPEPVQPAFSEPVTAPTAGPAPVTAPVAPVPEESILQPADAAVGIEDEDIESTRISVPGHRLVFTWDDGQRATVSGRTVFGRNPEEPGEATNVAVRDETRSLSKTHFEAGANTQGGWVMDRQSTNGTTIVRDGVRIACPPGQRVLVRLGDALEIGDRIVTIGGYV